MRTCWQLRDDSRADSRHRRPEKHQPFGEQARQSLSGLVYMRDARLDCPTVDRYGRSVCRVIVPSTSSVDGSRGLDAGLAMVEMGMAWWYRHYAREQTLAERGQYEIAELQARGKHAGLWRDPHAVPP